jgi:hypothetical protein
MGTEEPCFSDWLGAGRPRGRSSSPGKVKEFHFSGIQSVSYPMGTVGSLSDGEVGYSPPTSAEGNRQTNKNELRGPYAASELYRLNGCQLSTKFSANLCGQRAVAWSERGITYGR